MFLSGVVAILVTALILLINKVSSELILDFFREIRGTAHYQGESKGTETIFIITWIIFPLIYLGTVIVLIKSIKK